MEIMKTIYYNKKTLKQTQTQSEDTLPMTDELMADYREYAGNQGDKSLELIQEVGEIPYLVRYKLDEDANRYSIYKDEVDEDGYKLPDFEAIDKAKLQSDNQTKINEAKQYLASTDFYMTVDKYATLTEEKQLELTKLRQEARELINSLEDTNAV
jgi:hypothetical protein